MLCHGRIKAWEITVITKTVFPRLFLIHVYTKEWRYVQMNKQWLQLYVAAFLEVLWVIGLTYSYDFWTWLATVVLIVLSNYLMIKVAQELPAGTVYTVFVGLGTGGTVVAEVLFFSESLNIRKFILIIMIIAGVTDLILFIDYTNVNISIKERSGF